MTHADLDPGHKHFRNPEPNIFSQRDSELAERLLQPQYFPTEMLANIVDFVAVNQPDVPASSVIGSQFFERALYSSATSVSVQNTANETTLFTRPIGGGTLQTDGAVRVRLLGGFVNATALAQTFILRVKYGATTMYQDTSASLAVSANAAVLIFDLYLYARDSVTSQGLFGTMTISDRTNTATTGTGDLATAASTYVFGGTATENSALNKDFTITIQLSAANALLLVNSGFALLTKVAH